MTKIIVKCKLMINEKACFCNRTPDPSRLMLYRTVKKHRNVKSTENIDLEYFTV